MRLPDTRDRPPRALLWRTWALDAAWDPEHLQAVGVLHALGPVLCASRDPAAAFRRHRGPFGCNVYLAPALVGAMARLEATERGDEAVALRDRLSGALSGAGDAFVWKAARPACVVLALAGVFLGRPLAGLAVACAAHAIVLFGMRRRAFRTGWEQGAQLDAAFASVLPDARVAHRLQSALGVVAGVLAGWGIAAPLRGTPSGAFLVGAALLVGYHAARRRLSPGVVFLVLVVIVAALRRFSNPVGLP